MNPSTAAARAIVGGLIAAGIRHVVLSPGSRSAPLAYALADAHAAGHLEVHVRVDERVGAFTALGLARFGPAAVVTTSGTAAANLHPALLEAHHTGLPLLAVTADRPHELRGVGANQTTFQTHMFGPQIPFLEIPAGASRASILNQITRAVSRARGDFAPPTPLHINAAFRDPLVPETADLPPIAAQGGPRISPPEVRGRAVAVDVSAPSVVVAGDRAGFAAAAFAQRAGIPLLAEPSSGARGGPTAIEAYQRVLTGLNGGTGLAGEVEQVVVYGRPTLSRPVSALLAGARRVVVVSDSPQWVDVAGTATQVAAQAEPAGTGDPAWLAAWREAASALRGQVPLAGEVLRAALSRGGEQVMLGSSLAIRWADLYAPVGEAFTTSPVHASRGLAGIDGTIATATGIALGSGPIRAIVGDLTFAHDVGALALGPTERAAELQVVVLNDAGGGIFATLEHGQEAYRDTFERFFATPLAFDIAALANAYGFEYHAAGDAEQIRELLSRPVRGRSIVEVTLERVSGNSQE